MFNIAEEIALSLRAALTSTFKGYYIGNVRTENLPKDYLPALLVWGTQTRLLSEQLTTARDKYAFDISIKVVVDALLQAKQSEPKNATDSEIIELQAQKTLYNLVEERDTDMKPIATSILGLLRSNVQGVDYLFSNEIVVNYEEENVNGAIYHTALLTMQNVTRYNTR